MKKRVHCVLKIISTFSYVYRKWVAQLNTYKEKAFFAISNFASEVCQRIFMFLVPKLYLLILQSIVSTLEICAQLFSIFTVIFTWSGNLTAFGSWIIRAAFNWCKTKFWSTCTVSFWCSCVGSPQRIPAYEVYSIL